MVGSAVGNWLAGTIGIAATGSVGAILIGVGGACVVITHRSLAVSLRRKCHEACDARIRLCGGKCHRPRQRHHRPGGRHLFRRSAPGGDGPHHRGEGANIQDNCIVHADPGFPAVIGRDCTVGHAAILHGCTIGDNTLVGMGAIVLQRSRGGPGLHRCRRSPW
ncbi:MAG: hypothetical protein ACLU38_16130 [Dysosmobacter sp.]